MKRVSGSSSRGASGRGTKGTRLVSGRGYSGSYRGRFHRRFMEEQKLKRHNFGTEIYSNEYISHAWIYKIIAAIITFGIIAVVVYYAIIYTN